MFDDLPRPDRVVCTVFDYFGLGWLLLVPEGLFVFGAPWWKVALAVAFGIACVWFAHYWIVIKPKLGPSLVAAITWTANNFWLKRIAAVIVLGYLVAVVLSFEFRLRSDLDRYVMPRVVTESQKTEMRKVLMAHPSKVPIKVLTANGDQEAINYAGQLTDVLRSSGWNATFYVINPWSNGYKVSVDPKTGDLTLNEVLSDMLLDQGVVLKATLLGDNGDPNGPNAVLNQALMAGQVYYSNGGTFRMDPSSMAMIVARRTPVEKPLPYTFRIGQWLIRHSTF